MKQYRLFYPRREISVPHYPMPHLEPTTREPLKALEFLNKGVDASQGFLAYVHVPFCRSICDFCPFNRIQIEDTKVARYLKALMREFNWYKDTKYVSEKKVEAIYFGGGTPSALADDQLIALVSDIKRGFNLSSDYEITVEGNASSFSDYKLKKLFDIGVTRISIGVQSFDEKLIKMLGVPHTTSQSIHVMKQIRSMGFTNLSIDLMYNLPYQTMELWKKDLEKLIELDVDNVSLFPLMVIPGTKLFERFESKELEKGDLIKELEMQDYAINWLTSKGYVQTSAYDFVKPSVPHNYAKKHFSGGYDLLGLGVSAYGETNHRCSINVGKYEEYVKLVENTQLPINLQNEVPIEERINAIMVMGLRGLEVDMRKFQQYKKNPFELFAPQLEKLVLEGLLEIAAGKITPSRIGKLWGHNISKEFFSEEYKKTLPAWQSMEELANTKK